MTPKTRKGKITQFSRPLTPARGGTIASNVEENVTPSVPLAMLFVENEAKLTEEGKIRCDLWLTIDGMRDNLWTNAEQLLSLCLAHSQALADKFYSNGQVLCNIAVGVINGKIVVEPAA